MIGLKQILVKFKGINILKTIYANFAYFSFQTAIKFPIFIYGRTFIQKASKGKIIIAPEFIRPGILNIGTPILGFQTKSASTLFIINGKMNVNGKITIGKGCAIEVGNEGILSIGNNTTITGNTTILCTQSITIGGRCMISWDNLIMDTDWHNVVSAETGYVYPKQRPITIGEHVWIGCRCTILKNARILNDSVLASNSKLSKAVEKTNVLIGSNIILKEGITW